jgi:hypothetical protein
MRKQIVLAIAATAVALLAPSLAQARSHTTANHRLGVPELRHYSRGTDVAALQWLLSGHKPYAISKIKPTLHRYDKGVSGGRDSRTWKSVRAMKFRIGYPGIGQCTHTLPRMRWDVDAAGPYFFSLLLGHKHWPACWVALAAKRIAAAEAGATPKAFQLRAFELTKVGIAEPQAYWIFNSYFHLPPEAWCAIFQGYSEVHVGLSLLAPSNPWYVPNIITWGRYHGYLRATAKIGEFVLYYGDISHIGYVIGTDPVTGSYTTVEGNWRNQVGVVVHSRLDHLHYFLAAPRLA